MQTIRNQANFDAIHSKLVGWDIDTACEFTSKVIGIWQDPKAGPFTSPQVF